MPKYINVDEIDYKVICYPHLDLYTRMVSTEKLDGVYALKTDIDAMPPADVEEVRHGKWIYCGHHEMMGHAFQCSVCGRWMFTNFPKHVVEEQPYCHCGAKMESVEGLEED